MLHRTCEKLHGGVRLGGLSIPSILYMPLNFQPRGVKMYSLPYMVQIELTYISIKCGAFNSSIYWFLYKYIRVNSPTLNGNIGKFNLHHIWERVLLNTPGLKIKRHAQDIGHAQSTALNTPMQFFTGSMEHAQRTPISEHAHRTC